MSKLWTMYPPVASAEAAEYDAADHYDLGPDDLEPAEWERQDGQESEEEAEHWRAMAETDPSLRAELDGAERELRREEWEMLAAQMTAPAVGGLDSDEAPY